MYLPFIRIKATVKGIFQSSFPYTPLLENGDSSPYFGTYEGQRYGNYDTSCCWDFSACELAETRLEMFMKMNLIPKDTVDWLQVNGYIDSDGDFYVSRRWVAILSGVHDGGNDPSNFWRIANTSGLIPNSLLPYSKTDSYKWITKGQFNNDYFNSTVITPQMISLGKEFARRFDIKAENIWCKNYDDFVVKYQMYLKEGSVQLSHPVPQDGTWNQQFVKIPIGRTQFDHATEGYKFDATQAFPIYDYDSYEPHLKQLQAGYFPIFITRVSIKPVAIITPVTLPQFSIWMKTWFNILAWMKGSPLPYPSVPIGKVV